MILKIKNTTFEITDKVSQKNIEFEEELLKQKRVLPYLDSASITNVEISYYQRCRWLEVCEKEYLLLQGRNEKGEPTSQAAIIFFRPAKLKWFGYASIPYFGSSATSLDEEQNLLEAVKQILPTIKNVTRLHIRGWSTKTHELMNFEAVSRRAGLKIMDPTYYTRTLMLDLTGTDEEFFKKFTKRTIIKLKTPKRSELFIREIKNEEDIPKLQNALGSSFKRTTGNSDSFFEFEPYFKMAKKYPESTHMLCLSFADSPDEILAYCMAITHGSLAEMVSIGSVYNEALRKIDYTHLMFHDIFLWAREQGCTHIDFGGITDGSQGDLLAGISKFKRTFTNTEVEIGREMIWDFKPNKTWVFKKIQSIKNPGAHSI